MKFNDTKHKGSGFHFFEDKNIILGFSEIGSEIEDVGEFLRAEKIVQLEQVHGDKIFFSDEIKGNPDGDGIILNEKTVMAVIRTADCVPLFFWTTNHRFAGVIHIGWQGLYSEIGVNLIKMLKKKGIETRDLLFLTGPAIEAKCYTVQHDLVDKFSDFSFGKKIFKKTRDGFSMDVRNGIELCLIGKGIPRENIFHSSICTYCDSRFPSYRRGDREKRIFNFILLK